MKETKNRKLATNLLLMFMVKFLPKVFSFFLTPIYTAYLTTEEYGITDLIINTASLLSPFVAVGIASAVMRFTIENKTDKRPLHIAVKIFIKGMLLFGIVLLATNGMFNIETYQICFLYLIVGTSIFSDILMCYVRGIEYMTIITVCGVGSAVVSIGLNILCIVVFEMGVYGFLISTVGGYLFTIVILLVYCHKDKLWSGFFSTKDKKLQKEMLNYSIPLIFSGLSWWIISSSDRYFVTGLCGVAINGIYAVAYKIPNMLQAVQNVFSHAWVFTLYDSYKTKEGMEYIAKVYEFYSFIFCLSCSLLITVNIQLSAILYSNDFFEAYKYVPALLLAIVFNGLGNFMGGFLSAYKKTKIIAWNSTVAAGINIVLNYVLILVMDDAMGAAIATAITFFVSWILSTMQGIKLSNIKIDLKKQLLVFGILVIQSLIVILCKSVLLSSVGILLIIILGWNNVIYLKGKVETIYNRYRKKEQ